MANITASMVNDLRQRTGAGMMDCKKALTETNGDMEAAIDWLRKKGISSAAKKAGRVAAEGLVGAQVTSDGKIGCVTEINSETDFVARTPEFQSLNTNTMNLYLKNSKLDLEGLKEVKLENGKTLSDEITSHVAIIGENLGLRRIASVEVANGVVVPYVHNEIMPGFGKIAVIVAIESAADKAKLTSFGKQIAMHIAAARPDVLTIAQVASSNLEREKAIYKEQAMNSGKPESIVEKMVEGRVRKYYEEVVLLEQTFIMDNKTKISEVVENMTKELGTPVAIKSFVRFQLGEGIEQEKVDFAQEVAAAAGTK